jgi:hypothetical protein
MPKPTHRDVDAWFADLSCQLHAIYTERQLTPDQMRARMAMVSKQMASYRIRLWRRD